MANDFVSEEFLDGRNFRLVKDVRPSDVPRGPGLYCIRLKAGAAIEDFREEMAAQGHSIVYIGQASRSLFERFWEEELHHKKPGTFFRSLGAVLGFLPPKGSLKKDGRNYKFSDADTREIIRWIENNLVVNWIECPREKLDELEKGLIKTFMPLLNIKDNPRKLKKLSALRRRCVDVARGDSGEEVSPVISNPDFCDEDFENEDFADLLAAASFQDSVTGASGREQRELHRNVWEFWQVLRGEETDGDVAGGQSRRSKKNAMKQKPVELSFYQKKERTAWRIFYFDAAVFVLSCILGWKILMFICAAPVSLIYTWSILPKREKLRRYKFHDFALLFLINAFWISLMLWFFFGNALDPAPHSYY